MTMRTEKRNYVCVYIGLQCTHTCIYTHLHACICTYMYMCIATDIDVSIAT